MLGASDHINIRQERHSHTPTPTNSIKSGTNRQTDKTPHHCLMPTIKDMASIKLHIVTLNCDKHCIASLIARSHHRKSIKTKNNNNNKIKTK